MNRTILIVICDFLLVSLLAFSTVDINKVADQTSPRAIAPSEPAATNRIGGRQDLGDVMRLALEEERKHQESLSTELSRTRATAEQREALLKQRDAELQQRGAELQGIQQRASQLQEREAGLLKQMGVAQSNIANLQQQLQANTLETVITKEQRAAEEAEVKKQLDKAAQLRMQLAALERSNQLVTAEREQLANRLQVTEAEKTAAAARLAQAQQDLTLQHQENVKLAEGVKLLSTNSSELAREIRENRSLAPNTIFNELATNRVTVNFEGVKPGFFGGDSTKNKQTESILVTDGTNDYAICHVQETLFSLWEPGTPWRTMTGTIAHGSTEFPVNSLSFYALDPRIALMPIPRDWAVQMGCKVYKMASDPYKFQDAVVVGARQGYYGECQFQMDLSSPQYLRMDHNTLKGLFGKFNPSTGDLVFSRTGDLLGVMANNSYCIILRNFDSVATIGFGANQQNPPIANTLTSLYATVSGLPFKLQ
jgi:hypothetical protein